jgi:DNA-binding MarR family transcriptional regulator
MEVLQRSYFKFKSKVPDFEHGNIMDNQDYRTLRLLEEIERDNNLSQRGVAKKLNISLGLANSFIKRLAGKGYFKITSVPKNRVRYILTPEGFAEKTRLTYQYIQSSYRYYKEARMKFRMLLQSLTTNGVKNVALYGAGELAEIAYISFKETSLNITGVVDDNKIGHNFFGFKVVGSSSIDNLTFDRIFITDIGIKKDLFKSLMKKGISKEKIVFFE